MHQSMRIAIVVVLLSSPVFAHAAAKAAKTVTPCQEGAALIDTKYGYNNVKFDVAPSAIAGATQVAARDEFNTKRVTAYEVKPTDVSLYGQQVNAVTYFFFDNKLFLIRVITSDLGGMYVVSGFERALGCDLVREEKEGYGTMWSVTAKGAKASVVAEYFKASQYSGRESYVKVTFEKNGVRPLVQKAAKEEAQAQF